VPGRRINFGSHQLDRDAAILWRAGERCVLQAQPLRLLTLLIERRGEVVTRDDIREQLWSDTVVEYDQGINFAIRQIRIALGPDAHLVQTVPRRGYRFVGDLTPVMIPAPPRRSRVTGPIAAAILLALASGFGAGIITRDAPAGQFVYDHLVHPGRCPYLRVFLPAHRNS
jgi:DNA-binding winged helix-turn-helix (wHTH) protein